MSLWWKHKVSTLLAQKPQSSINVRTTHMYVHGQLRFLCWVCAHCTLPAQWSSCHGQLSVSSHDWELVGWVNDQPITVVRKSIPSSGCKNLFKGVPGLGWKGLNEVFLLKCKHVNIVMRCNNALQHASTTHTSMRVMCTIAQWMGITIWSRYIFFGPNDVADVWSWLTGGWSPCCSMVPALGGARSHVGAQLVQMHSRQVEGTLRLWCLLQTVRLPNYRMDSIVPNYNNYSVCF